MSQIPETNPDLALKGPLPEGWTTEYSPQWNEWYYVDTRAEHPQAVWTHPKDINANPPAYAAEPHSGHTDTTAPGPSAVQPTNPDTRPLPQGWIDQYSPEHKTFFYVNEAAPDPGATVTWAHPADAHHAAADTKSPATTSTQAHVNSAVSSAAPAGGSTTATGPADSTAPHQNLPPGWKAQFDTNYKAWYYINTNDTSAGPTWTLPAAAHTQSTVPPVGQHSGSQPPTTTQPSYTTTSPKKTADPLPQPTAGAAPGVNEPTTHNPTQGIPNKENPDQRPLPPGWISKFDQNYGVWYYVDTTKPGSAATWEHPADAKPAPGAPSTPGAGTSGAYGPAGVPPANQQPGAQPPSSPGGKGLEGLIGGNAGKMISGLFGEKGRAQMDMFANKIAPEVDKLKSKYGSSSSSSQGPPGAPPTSASGKYAAPTTPAPGQQKTSGVPGQAPLGSPPPSGQGSYGAPPPGQGQYSPPSGYGQGSGQGPHPPGPPGVATGHGQAQGQYNAGVAHPPAGGPPPSGPPPGQQQGSSGSGGGGVGGLGGLTTAAGLGSLAEKFGKFGLGKK